MHGESGPGGGSAPPRPAPRRVVNPFRSEEAMFRVLVWAVALLVVGVALVVALRAIL